MKTVAIFEKLTKLLITVDALNINCTGDDSYDHTITDKVQAYNPQEKTWSVEVRHYSYSLSLARKDKKH